MTASFTLYSHRVAGAGALVTLACGLGWLVSTGCVAERLEREPPEELLPHIKRSLPEGLTAIGANFGGKATLVGVTVTPQGPLKPGDQVSLELWWRVDETITEPGWRLFTHVLDQEGKRLLNLDNVGPLRRVKDGQQAYPPSRWRAGVFYQDVQSFTVPRPVKTDVLEVVAGIWKDQDRLHVVSGASPGADHAVVARLEIDRPAPIPESVPELRVGKKRPDQPIALDGRLDELAWDNAAPTPAFVNVSTGAPDPRFPIQGSAKLTWDSTHLYVGVQVTDPDLRGGFDPKIADPHLWTRDCVELMIDPDGDNRDYYEIQINPQNLVFDSRFDSYNTPVEQPNGPFGHQEWSSRAESAVRLQGTLDQSQDRDEGYVVEARIPWAVFTHGATVPPHPGDTWRMNLYAMQSNQGVAWSPILRQGNFHKASRFGRVTWADVDGVLPGITAKVSAPAGGASAAPVSPAGERLKEPRRRGGLQQAVAPLSPSPAPAPVVAAAPPPAASGPTSNAPARVSSGTAAAPSAPPVAAVAGPRPPEPPVPPVVPVPAPPQVPSGPIPLPVAGPSPRAQ